MIIRVKSIDCLLLYLLQFMLFSNLPAQNSTFLEKYYFANYDGQDHYILDMDLIHAKYGNDIDLFEYPYQGAILYMEEENVLLSFVLDPAWNKLVYGEYEEKWVKIYGSHITSPNGWKRWRHPRSVVTNDDFDIFVTDTENGRIIVLHYYPEYKEVLPAFIDWGNGVEEWVIGGNILDHPWDIDIDDRGNLDFSDDIIWVVDSGPGQIVPLTIDGSIWQNKTITSLYYNGTFYNDLTGVTGIAIKKNQGVNSTDNARLYLVDWKLRKLFLVEVSSIGAIDDGIGIVSYEKTFASDVVLSGVESDYFGDVWVVDNAKDRIYKYTWDGQWLDQLTGLNNPTSIASVRRHHRNMALTERWTNTTGQRTYSHGADIKNLSISTSSTSAVFKFRLTNHGYLTAKIYKGSSWVKTLNNHDVYSSGNKTLKYYNKYPSGTYTLKLWAYSHHTDAVYHYEQRDFVFASDIEKKERVHDREIPKEFALFQNYPNPFNPSTAIVYHVPVESEITLRIYDVLGREIATLVDDVETPGVKTVAWNGATSGGEPAASGVYFYMLYARPVDGGDSFLVKRKFTLIR